MTHGEGSDRGGERTGSQQGGESCRGEHLGRVQGELSRSVAGIVADDHDPAGTGAKEVVGDASGRTAHDGEIHSGRTGAQGAA